MSRQIDEIPEASRLPMNIGFTLTVVWAACIIALVVYFSPENWQDFKLNEVGDFIAGVSAPLAFLWLVVGIWQQGEDLRLQRADLQLSMKMTREIAETGKAELALAVGAAQPRFVNCQKRHQRSDIYIIEGTNTGDVAHDLRVIENWSTSEVDMKFRLPESRRDRPSSVVKFISDPSTSSGWIKFGYSDRSQSDQILWAYLTFNWRLHFRDHGDGPLNDDSELRQWLSQAR